MLVGWPSCPSLMNHPSNLEPTESETPADLLGKGKIPYDSMPYYTLSPAAISGIEKKKTDQTALGVLTFS